MKMSNVQKIWVVHSIRSVNLRCGELRLHKTSAPFAPCLVHDMLEPGSKAEMGIAIMSSAEQGRCSNGRSLNLEIEPNLPPSLQKQ